MKTILVTGGAGFIGSHFIKMILDKRPEYKVINIDNLTYAGDLSNLPQAPNDRYRFYKVDICDKIGLERVFSKHPIDCVINFAAESHVDRSIQSPEVFIKTNVLGTQTLLEVARIHWSQNWIQGDTSDLQYKEGVKFVQISTDEVYGSTTPDCKFTELSPLCPSSPYSASKAGADLIVFAYSKTYNMPINITRCGNNYGPNQHVEKLIPLVIKKALSDEEIPIYGDGLQMRDWVYVEDHCLGILKVLEEGKIGSTYNISGGDILKNVDVAEHILKILQMSKSKVVHIEDRKGHDYCYALNCSKIANELGWQRQVDFEEGLVKTIKWYKGE